MKNTTDKETQEAYYRADLDLKKFQLTRRIDNSIRMASDYKKELENKGHNYPLVDQEYETKSIEQKQRLLRRPGHSISEETELDALEQCFKLANRLVLFYMNEFQKHRLIYTSSV